jgi:allantoin racemase
VKRILVINPNSSVSMTESIDRSIGMLRFSGGPQIDVIRLETTPEGIENQEDVESVVIPLVRRIEAEDADGFVVACFSDPGLHMARENVRQPVLGAAESAYAAALTLGTRIGVVSIGQLSLRRHARYLRELGHYDKLVGDRPINTGTAGLKNNDTIERIIAVGKQLRDEDGADVLVLACAGMGDFRATIQKELDMPVVDPVQSAVAAAIGRVMLDYEARA